MPLRSAPTVGTGHGREARPVITYTWNQGVRVSFTAPDNNDAVDDVAVVDHFVRPVPYRDLGFNSSEYSEPQWNQARERPQPAPGRRHAARYEWLLDMHDSRIGMRHICRPSGRSESETRQQLTEALQVVHYAELERWTTVQENCAEAESDADGP